MTTYSILPAGVSAAAFGQAIEAFRAILGAEHVLLDPERLAPYRKVYIAVAEDALAPSAALMPTTVPQIQQIVEVCNRHRVPVWPISTGRNIGMGSATAATRGQVILDLKRMNRIIEVDAELGTALIEPGVTYLDLKNYLEEHRLPFWVDAPSPGPIVSPIGNTLERGHGYTTHQDHVYAFSGMEIVLASGAVLRTGMGPLPNCKSWQAFRSGYGPYIDGLFTQSNYGIITKMGVWLTPVQEGARSFVVYYDRHADLVAAVDTFRQLRLAGIISVSGSILDGLTLLAFGQPRHSFWSGSGAIPRAERDALLQEKGLPQWRVGGVVYGDDEETAIKLRKIQRAFAASRPREILIEDSSGVRPSWGAGDLASATGQLSLDAFRILNYIGGGGVLFHMPVAAMKGRYVQELCSISERVLREHGFDYLSMNWCNDRDMHQTTGIFFDRSDPAQMQAAHACYDVLMRETSAAGFGNYRVSTHYMDKAAELFGPELRGFLRSIKRAVDPAGILAPGKSGIHI
ncbi:MAG: FAD-binding oxidoreductase [Gammaproteobacteria bacterium]|nr:FAD-binding oxidoreductase [Gammaproteobacteria bacterium]